MKISKRVILTIATACLVSGLALSAVAYALAGFNLQGLSTASGYTQASYSAEKGNYHEITLKGASEDVTVVRTTGDVVEVEYFENEQQSYDIRENNDSLEIIENHQPAFMFFNFNFTFEETGVTIKVPESFDGSLYLNSASGNITVQDLSQINALDARSLSGDISVRGITLAGDLRLDTASGSILFTDAAADSATLKSLSGSVDIRQLTIENQLVGESASGNIDVSDLLSDSLQIKSMSGDMLLQTITTNKVLADTASGRIQARSIAVEDTTLKTMSGNIEALFGGTNDEYRISTTSLSGEINTPSGNSAATKSISAESASGDISFSFAGDK